MNPLDIAGHLGYIGLAIGTYYAGKGDPRGWALRCAASALWAAIGYAMGMTSILVWSGIFMAIDANNALKKR